MRLSKKGMRDRVKKRGMEGKRIRKKESKAESMKKRVSIRRR